MFLARSKVHNPLVVSSPKPLLAVRTTFGGKHGSWIFNKEFWIRLSFSDESTVYPKPRLIFCSIHESFKIGIFIRFEEISWITKSHAFSWVPSKWIDFDLKFSVDIPGIFPVIKQTIDDLNTLITAHDTEFSLKIFIFISFPWFVLKIIRFSKCYRLPSKVFLRIDTKDTWINITTNDNRFILQDIWGISIL